MQFSLIKNLSVTGAEIECAPLLKCIYQVATQLVPQEPHIAVVICFSFFFHCKQLLAYKVCCEFLCVISTGSGSELQFVAIQSIVVLTSFILAFVLHAAQLHLTMSFDEAYYYILSPEKWHNWGVYMENNKEGNVRGWNGDPGPQGHWIAGPYAKIGMGGFLFPIDGP